MRISNSTNARSINVSFLFRTSAKITLFRNKYTGGQGKGDDDTENEAKISAYSIKLLLL